MSVIFEKIAGPMFGFGLLMLGVFFFFVQFRVLVGAYDFLFSEDEDASKNKIRLASFIVVALECISLALLIMKKSNFSQL